MKQTDALKAGFPSLKVYTFNKTVLFDEGGLESCLFESDDGFGSFFTERACFEAALRESGVEGNLSLFTDYALDTLAIGRGLYVEFIDN